MKHKQQFFKANPLKFKQFTRKGYALFSTLGKVVVIGVLAVATIGKARAEGAETQTNTARDSLMREGTELDEVVVTGSHVPLTGLQTAKIVTVLAKDDIARQAAANVNDLLKTLSGVDVRQRGAFGVQTDISMRGGNFDQITFLLNGVNISSPHTGHLSADFPLSASDIERIEVVNGSAARVYGASAFNGVINIITRQTGELVNANIGGGSYGFFNANAGVNINTNLFSTYLSGGYSRSDGAVANSAFSSSRLFWQGKIKLKNALVAAQFGYSYKPYEANTFYGAASTDQWESNERLMAAVNAEVRVGKVHIAPGAYWNRWFDHYQWHRGDPAGENYHRADAAGATLSAWTETILGKTSLGADIRRESIWSTKLGKQQDESSWKNSGGHDGNSSIKYMFHDARTITSFFLEHNILLRRWTVSLGATALHTPLAGWDVEPGIDLAFRPSSTLKIFASWNTGLRLPTFTDLYYSGANIEGNSDLKAEKTCDVQIGARKIWRGFRAEAQLFFSHKSDMIDWVVYQEAGDDIFHSVNFRMNNFGGDIGLSFLPQELFGERFPLRKISANYSYIREHSRYGLTVVESKYAMEYLRNKLVLAADGKLWRGLNLSLAWRFCDRIGDNADYAILDGKLSWDARRWSIYVDAANILNKKYFDYVSIAQPGFVATAGVNVRL
ncbi:MAG: TonB-dependent receptor [Prevotella sp.]|nr:TonB-dependent receptor [Prevotella sp.]